MDHLGIEVDEADQVNAATQRLKDAGPTFEENDASCCYALQDKVWVHGPGQEPWEVYVVKADADVLGESRPVSLKPPPAAHRPTRRPPRPPAVAAANALTSGGGCQNAPTAEPVRR